MITCLNHLCHILKAEKPKVDFLEQLRSHACFPSLHYSNMNIIKAVAGNREERLRAISAAVSKRRSLQQCKRTFHKNFKIQCSIIPFSSVTLTDVTFILSLAWQRVNHDLLPSSHNEVKIVVYNIYTRERVKFNLRKNSPFMASNGSCHMKFRGSVGPG